MRSSWWLLAIAAGCAGSEAATNGGEGEPVADGGSRTGDAAPGASSSSSGGDGAVADGPVQYAESPWGIASSASSSRGLSGWLPDIAATGVTWLRGFDTAAANDRLLTAAASNVQVAGILFYSPSEPATFPTNDLPGFETYLDDLLGTCAGRVKYWEVWNEPPNFTEDKDPASYATIVKTAYDTLKANDPTLQVGLAAQSNNVNWLVQTLDAGAAGHFDYVTVHPYEILDQVKRGWEASYLSVVPTLRKMLADKDPAHVNAPIWFTEMGEPVGAAATPAQQATTVVKSYVLGLAQGVARMHWFEGIDGDSGPFGLIAGNGEKRPAYAALKNLIAALGDRPAYDGWVLLEGEHYGFVFEHAGQDVVVAWAQPDTTAAHTFEDGQAVTLTPDPVTVIGRFPALVAEARQNRRRAFPWGGDYSAATSVSIAPNEVKGLHVLGTPEVVTVDGVAAFSAGVSSGPAFTVDPSFLSYDVRPIVVTAVVRRIGSKNAGFNLKYESTTGYSGGLGWFGIPEGTEWTTKSWSLTDAQLVGKWAYNFSFDADSTENSQFLFRSVTVAKQ